MDEVLKDKRFAHITRDPRYRKIPREERKVKIDSRFKSMFEDKRFKLKYSVDKRGRPINLTTNENLRKFYELSDDSSEDDDEKEKVETSGESDSDSEKKGNSKDGVVDGNRKNKTKTKQTEASKSVFDRNVSSKEHTKESKTDNKKANKNIKNANIAKTFSREQDKGFIDTDTDSSSADEDESDVEDVVKKGADSGVDIARGEGPLESSSSDDDDEVDEDESGDDEFDHKWGEVDSGAVNVSEGTNRLAVCTLDWDRVKAKDIFAILNSFKPANGLIISVKVYPSEYGQARLEEERAQGPRELIEETGGSKGGDDNAVDHEGTRYHTEKLRKYQLSRLKYYYAVVECDSTATASTIYDDCDGMEYETSSTKLDLRYIPDDMEFDQAATSECTEMPHGFKPILFANTALSQCKVDLTWDETDQERVQSTAQVWASRDKDVPEDDLKAYLASSSDDEGPDYGSLLDVSEDGASDSGGEGDEERQIARYRSLLQDIDTSGGNKSKPRDVEMEITWEPGLKETTEGIIRKKKNSKDLTPWEEYLQRKKEKKKKKRSERKKKVDEYEDVEETEQPDDGNAAFSDDELPAGVDVNDPLFTDELKTLDNGKKEKKKKKKDKKKDVNENTQEQAELSLLMMDEEEDKRHFNLKDLVEDSTKHKKKKKKPQEDSKDKDDDNFQVNVADPRFAAMFDSHHYNIDPSAPEYKKTKGTEAIITEKLKRRRDKGKKEKYVSSSDNVVKDKKRKTESDGDMSQAPVMKDNTLAMLVKSVKVKTHQFQSNKKR